MKHKVKHIHFVGVGGSGMSGIAEVLAHLDYAVSGSDLAGSALLEQEAQAALRKAADDEARARARTIALDAGGALVAPAIAAAVVVYYAKDLLVVEAQLALQVAQVLCSAVALPVAGVTALVLFSPGALQAPPPK